MSYITLLGQANAAPANASSAAPAAASTQQPASGEAPKNEQAQGGGWGSLIMIGCVVVIFYFLMIRPQVKQQKELRAKQEALKVGDKVITNAGIHGIIRELKEQAVMLEIAPNVVIKVMKNCVVANVDKSGNSDAPVK